MIYGYLFFFFLCKVQILHSLYIHSISSSSSVFLSVTACHIYVVISTDTPMGCRGYCSPAPSPHRLSALLPNEAKVPFMSINYGDDIDRIHLLRVAIIAIASTAGVMIFLFVLFKIIGNYYTWRYYNRERNAPILFDIHGDSPSSDDEGAVINHPIWFINTVGLQQSIIDSITVCKYRKDEGLVEVTECSVCLAEFQEDESLRLLPKCSHAFHVPCIDTWLRSHKNCPLCRAPIVRETSGRESSVVTVPDFNVSGEIHGENFDGGLGNHDVGEGESSEVRVGDDDSGIMPTEDGEGSEVSEKNLGNSDKMNYHSARVSRSGSMDSSYHV